MVVVVGEERGEPASCPELRFHDAHCQHCLPPLALDGCPPWKP